MSDDKKINYGTVEIPDSDFEPETVMILKSIYDKKVKLLKAAKAEIERLKTERDLAQGLADSRPTAELFANTLKNLREELTREREISAMLLERLNLIRSHDRLRGYPTGDEWMKLVQEIADTIAREKEMRK